MDIELRELKYFVAVAKLGTLTKAADSLFISQPALTKAIKKLEQSIGADLFDREKNQLKITDVGQELLKKSQCLMNDYEELWARINDVKNLDVGHISIGLPPCTIPLLFHHTFLQFKKTYPNICIDFSDNGREEVVKGLLSGDFDLGFMIEDTPNSGIEEVPLYTTEMVAVMHKSHKLAKCDVIRIEQLKEFPLCILQRDYLMAQQILLKCHLAGFDPIIGCSSSNCDFLIKMAQSKNQIATVPRAIYLEKTYEDMIALPFDEPWLWILCMAWKKDSYLSYAVRTLRSIILDQFLDNQ